MSAKSKFLFLFLMVCICRNVVIGQIITTVAGGVTGHGGYWGDGTSATNAAFGGFGGLAVDKSGNIYIADASNQRIRKVDGVTGVVTTVAGTGVAGYNGDNIIATSAKLNAPSLVCVDAVGNFYFNDALNYRIRKVDKLTGVITTFAGNGTFGFAGDNGPATAADCDFQAFTFDLHGDMIVESSRSHRIRKINHSGIISTIAGTGFPGNTGDGGAATAATMSPNAVGICTDMYGNIYFADSFQSIRKIDVSTGIIRRVAGTGDLIGTPYSGDGGQATATHLTPVAMSIDDSGNLYISDFTNSRIEKVDTFGIIHTIAGIGTNGYSGDSGAATDAKINYPENVVLDKCNNVYIADFGNARVRKITYRSCDYTFVNEVNNNKDNIHIYPNPANNQLTITTTEKINSITITNMLGQSCGGLTMTKGDKEATLNIEYLPAGMYMVRVNEVWVGRFLKEL